MRCKSFGTAIAQTTNGIQFGGFFQWSTEKIFVSCNNRSQHFFYSWIVLVIDGIKSQMCSNVFFASRCNKHGFYVGIQSLLNSAKKNNKTLRAACQKQCVCCDLTTVWLGQTNANFRSDSILSLAQPLVNFSTVFPDFNCHCLITLTLWMGSQATYSQRLERFILWMATVRHCEWFTLLFFFLFLVSHDLD